MAEKYTIEQETVEDILGFIRAIRLRGWKRICFRGGGTIDN